MFDFSLVGSRVFHLSVFYYYSQFCSKEASKRAYLINLRTASKRLKKIKK